MSTEAVTTTTEGSSAKEEQEAEEFKSLVRIAILVIIKVIVIIVVIIVDHDDSNHTISLPGEHHAEADQQRPSASKPIKRRLWEENCEDSIIILALDIVCFFTQRHTVTVSMPLIAANTTLCKSTLIVLIIRQSIIILMSL